ncbi:MAG: carboxypeptidase-like regulatory domain-containing protein [archaeon]|nr:carboxypeptidase-like regulatory domain-containing protein [archaeon]
MLKGLLTGLLLGTSVLLAQDKPKEIRPKDDLTKKLFIIDSKTKEPLPGANIFLGGNNGLSTDINGYATLHSNTDTTYNVKISYIGYESDEKTIPLDKDSTTITIPLTPSAVESSEVLVISKKEDSLEEILRSTERINEEKIKNTQLITGSATEQISAQLEGVTTTPGKTFYFSSGEEGILIKYHGIPMKSSDFFNISGVLNSEDTDFEVVYFTPPPDKEGMILNIDARMKKPKKGLELLMQINHLRGNVGLSGNLNASTWFGLNYEGNLSSLYLNSQDIRPRNNKYNLVASKEWGNSSLTFAGIHKNTGIVMTHNDKSPSLNGIQTGASLEYKTLSSKSSLELLYVFNRLEQNYSLKDFLSSGQSETMHEFNAKLGLENPLGFLTTGIDVKRIFYFQKNLLIEGDDLFYNLLKEKIPENQNSAITPATIFFNQEIILSKKSALALGTGMLFDVGNFKKSPAFGPYLKFASEVLGMKTTLTGRGTFSHIGLKSPSEELDIKEYATSSGYPKSFQTKLEFEKGPLNFGIAYYNFYNHPKTNLDPIREFYLEHSKEINEDSLRAAIILENPEIRYNPKSMKELNSLIATLSGAKGEFENEMGNYGERYYSNPNRHGFAGFASLRTENFFLSGTLSKTLEEKSNTPYINDINLILKGHAYSDLSKLPLLDFIPEKTFTLSAYLEYSTGRPYTDYILLPSIAKERGIESSLEEYKEGINTKYYKALSEKRKVPKERNQERYPPSITSSVSLSYHLPFLPGGIEGYLRVYVNNPHNLFNIIEKNTYQIYHTITSDGRLITKEGKSLGFTPGIDLTLRIPF